jgi:hypothetical protein
MNYTVEYGFDSEKQCGKVTFSDKVVLMDFKDLFSIINHDRTFTRYTSEKQFPFYMRNQQLVSYMEHIFKYSPENINYIFKNGDSYDLRRSNVEIFHNYHTTVTQKYEVTSYQLGHITTNGRSAYTMKNPIWRINENGTEYMLMYCEKDTLCKLCPISYQKILDFENEQNNKKKLTFYKHTNGYIGSHVDETNGLLIHQIINDCYGNGKGTHLISVDHMDQDPLNNTYDNLRITTRKEQEQNSNGIKKGTKRSRKADAHPYPEGITHDMLPKYIHYPKPEEYGTNGKTRTCFIVEKHPTLIAHNKKSLCSSKSEKVSPEEKLQQAIDILAYLDKGEMPPEKEPALPKYYSLSNARGKPHLVYERRREDGTRMNVKMVLPEDFEMSSQVERLAAKVSVKYPEVCNLICV